jgi:hypothetical protein
MSQARDGDNLAIRCADYNWRDAGKIYFVWMQDSERHACATTGIDCISTRLQDRISGCGGKIMTGGHGMAVTIESWSHVKFPPWMSSVEFT